LPALGAELAKQLPEILLALGAAVVDAVLAAEADHEDAQACVGLRVGVLELPEVAIDSFELLRVQEEASTQQRKQTRRRAHPPWLEQLGDTLGGVAHVRHHAVVHVEIVQGPTPSHFGDEAARPLGSLPSTSSRLRLVIVFVFVVVFVVVVVGAVVVVVVVVVVGFVVVVVVFVAGVVVAVVVVAAVVVSWCVVGRVVVVSW
jgi:hypothetical protein